MYNKINDQKGYGLVSLKTILEGEFIGEYTGIVRRHKRSLDKKNSYCFEYHIKDKKRSLFTIDAKLYGNIIRFVNHSAAPNITSYGAYSKGLLHVILVANTKIEKGEELTYDYGPIYWNKRDRPI